MKVPPSFFPLIALVHLITTPLFAQTGDPVAGEKTFLLRCGGCHEAGTNKPVATAENPTLGPSLQGLFGRQAGTLPGYAFSDAMRAADFTWDQAFLIAYMSDPKKLVPQNKMPFNGLKRPGEAEDIIAYLKAATE